MPIYEYRCSACGASQEVLQKIKDPAPGTCPACGAENTMAKAVSQTSFALKGGGWYKDLYASSGASSSAGGGSSDD